MEKDVNRILRGRQAENPGDAAKTAQYIAGASAAEFGTHLSRSVIGFGGYRIF